MEFRCWLLCKETFKMAVLELVLRLRVLLQEPESFFGFGYKFSEDCPCMELTPDGFSIL